MLSVTDLLTISTKPKKQDISLQTIQTFYKEHLCGRIFTYELDDEERPFVKLRFEEKHLCHLLGIQYVVQHKRNKYDYAGESGYQKIEDGTLTFDSLNKINTKWFKSQKNRMLYFPFVYQVVHSPKVIVFTPVGPNLDLDIILYNHLDNTYLHLGLDCDTDSDYYYPKSFYDRKKDDHIAGRTELAIKNIKIDID